MNFSEFLKDLADARKERLKDPDFMIEIAKEEKLFKESLEKAGSDTLSAAYKMILRFPGKSIQSALKTISHKKYKAGDAVVDSWKAFWVGTKSSIKALSSILLAGGRGIKLGVRKIIAK